MPFCPPVTAETVVHLKDTAHFLIHTFYCFNMQTCSRSRLEPKEVPLQLNTERTRVSTAPIEPRDNSHKEFLQRRIAELEAQLRTATMQNLQ